MSEDLISSTINENDSILSLPVRKKDLGNFISGLLGQQQSIERELDLEFDIDHNWLINLHQLINQRIHQQASAKLVDFTSVIYFKDGMKRTLTSIESFESYSETKNELPVGIKIIWNYLVQFPNRDFPEKQQISFSALIHYYDKENLGHINTIVDLIFIRSFKKRPERSTIRYQIDHSERTWGDDIETILSNKTDEVLRLDTRLDKIYELSRYLLSSIILIGGLTYIFSNLLKTSNKVKEEMANYQFLAEIDPTSIELINNKIDSIAVMLYSAGTRDENAGLSILTLFVMGFLVIFFLELTRKKMHSFLSLSKASIKHRTNILKKESRSNIYLLLSYILSIAAGTLGNYGYSWLIN